MTVRQTKRLGRLLTVYSVLAAAGLALGLASSSTAQTPQQEMAEKVQRAIERIARESAEPTGEPDAGAKEAAHPVERAPVVGFKPSPEPEAPAD
ncbi:MAG: hypothetical protein JRI55_28655, partial [Deltaproteobacteria bacterium]|nr:hypothetical protein [Deltaproteobacteria bacterium]